MNGIETAQKQSRSGAPGKGVNPGLSRNWYLLAGVAVANALGMAFAVSPLLGGQIMDVWPWANTSFILLGGLALSITLLVIHLTVQQRKLTEIQKKISQTEVDAHLLERQNRERLRAILNISSMMGSVTNKAKLFNYITDTCRDLFHSEHASLMLLNKEQNKLIVQATSGKRHEEEVNITTREVGEGLSGWVAKTQRALILSPGVDVSRYPGLDVSSMDVTAAMVAPILLRDGLIGILSVRSRVPGARFNVEDLQALQVLAENIGTVIHHSEHVEWMRNTIEQYKTNQSSEEIPFTIDKIPTD